MVHDSGDGGGRLLLFSSDDRTTSHLLLAGEPSIRAADEGVTNAEAEATEFMEQTMAKARATLVPKLEVMISTLTLRFVLARRRWRLRGGWLGIRMCIVN